MSSIRGIRFWQENSREVSLAESLARAATTNAPVESLLVLTARSLLEKGQADRAAVWLRSEKEAVTLAGCVVDAGSMHKTESWERLELAPSALNDLLADREPFLIRQGEERWAAVLEHLKESKPAGLKPASGIKAAIVLPLACAGEVWGVALVAYATDASHESFEYLHAITAHLAVAVCQRQQAVRAQRLNLQVSAFAEMERSLAAEEPAEVILERLAEFMRGISGADFVAVGRCSGSGSEASFNALAGAREILPLLNEAALAPVWRAVIKGRRAIVENFHAVPDALPWRTLLSRHGVAEILVLPLEAGGEVRGVLVVGLGTDQSPAAVRQNLEPLAALAARALGDEALRMQRKEVDAELAAVLDSMESGIVVFDAQGRLRLSNARFAHLLGVDPLRLAQLADFEQLLGEVRQRFRDPRLAERRWREIITRGTEAAWDELEILLPGRLVLERHGRPVLGTDGQRIGWLELYRDITGERMIQSKLLQTEKMAALGQLVSGIAHELNNPLTGIMGYAQLLLSRSLDAQPAEEARRIFEEAERAGRIVKNLLLFASGKKPERKPVDLNEIIERTLALRSYELKVQNIAVVLELDRELPLALADAHQLQQVVLNLLVNAEQAIQQCRGSGRITVRTRRVSAGRMALEVSDDGPGIPPEIASRIFDPFFTTKPVGVGTGLGLSIVYGIVQEHGGEVTVQTGPGRGTDFVIELPTLGQQRIPDKPADHPLTGAGVPASARGRKILVIEDEPTVAQLVVDVLSEEGHQAEALLDSVEALARIQRQSYDLVICDLRMPRLDGRDLYLALVRNGNSVQNRMIFITGDTLTPHTLEFLEGNSLPYLAKPFLVEELKRAVEHGLNQGLSQGLNQGLNQESERVGPSLLLPAGRTGPYLTSPQRGGKG